MSNLVEYARSELTLAGLFDADADYDGAIGPEVLRLVEVFSQAGHSGGSAAMTLAAFDRVVRFKPLTPLTSDPEQWMEVGPEVWQSRRSPSVFSKDGGKTWYDLDEPKAQKENPAS